MGLRQIQRNGRTYWRCGAPYLAANRPLDAAEKAHAHTSAAEAEHCARLHDIILELVEALLAEGVDPDGLYFLLQEADDLPIAEG